MSDGGTERVIRVVALHRRPADPEAYESYYLERHMPLAMRVPGVKRIRVGKVAGTPEDGEPPFWLMSEVHFEGEAALEHAMASSEMKAALDDIPNFAADSQITIMYCATEDVFVDGAGA